MGKPKWVGELREDLFNLKWEEFSKKHPDIKYNTYKGKRSYWATKLGINLRELNMEQERVAKSWDVSAFNRETNEWETTRNYSYDHTPTLDLDLVVPRRLIPSRKQPPKRDYKAIAVVSDAQIGYRAINGEMIPIHDETAISAATRLIRNLQPDTVVDCGDTTDFGELSKYPKDSTQIGGPTLQASMQRTYDFYADISEAAPKAEKHAVDSNHVKRLGDFILRNAYPLADLSRIGDQRPVWSYPDLLHLDQLGWTWHGGYGEAEYRYSDKLAFKHGTLAANNNSTASKLSNQNYGRNIVQGHAHRMETQYRTDRDGTSYAALVVGALCRIDGLVPSYHSSIDQDGQPLKQYENWQQGILIIKDYGDDQYQFDQVPIRNGVILYEGRVYDGN